MDTETDYESIAIEAAEAAVAAHPGAGVSAPALAASALEVVRSHPRLEHEHLHAWLTRCGLTHLIVPAPAMLDGETHRAYHERTGCPHPEAIVGEPHHEFMARTKRAHVQGRPGESLDELINRIPAPRHDDAHAEGELKSAHCRSKGHDARRNARDRHEHRDRLHAWDGTRMPATVCMRCHHADQALAFEHLEKLATERAQLVERLGLSPDSAEALFPVAALHRQASDFLGSLRE
jgi:hypothetical protein